MSSAATGHEADFARSGISSCAGQRQTGPGYGRFRSPEGRVPAGGGREATLHLDMLLFIGPVLKLDKLSTGRRCAEQVLRPHSRPAFAAIPQPVHNVPTPRTSSGARACIVTKQRRVDRHLVKRPHPRLCSASSAALRLAQRAAQLSRWETRGRNRRMRKRSALAACTVPAPHRGTASPAGAQALTFRMQRAAHRGNCPARHALHHRRRCGGKRSLGRKRDASRPGAVLDWQPCRGSVDASTIRPRQKGAFYALLQLCDHADLVLVDAPLKRQRRLQLPHRSLQLGLLLRIPLLATPHRNLRLHRKHRQRIARHYKRLHTARQLHVVLESRRRSPVGLALGRLRTFVNVLATGGPAVTADPILTGLRAPSASRIVARQALLDRRPPHSRCIRQALCVATARKDGLSDDRQLEQLEAPHKRRSCPLHLRVRRRVERDADRRGGRPDLKLTGGAALQLADLSVEVSLHRRGPGT